VGQFWATVDKHGLYQHILHHYEKSYLVDSSKDVCWFLTAFVILKGSIFTMLWFGKALNPKLTRNLSVGSMKIA